MRDVIRVPTLNDLRRHVRQTLCSHDRLDPGDTALHESLILRAGRPCGLFFQAQGPRLLKNYAVWAGDERRILFYNSTGLRFGESRLTEGPSPRELAA